MRFSHIVTVICSCLLAIPLGFSQGEPTTQPPMITQGQVPAIGTTPPVPQNGTTAPIRASDPQAMNLLAVSLSAMGGPQATAVKDFTATGNITYYWAGKEETGSVTVRGKGLDELRFDSVLANGTRSWAVHGGSGSLLDSTGKSTPMSFHNAIALGSLTFPFARLQALSIDTSASLSYGGTSSVANQSFEHIRVHKSLFAKDPDGSGNRLMDAEFYFDPTTHLLAGIHDQTHPVHSMTVDVPHAVYFGDYRSVNGLLVPFSVSEYVGGQHVWSVQLTEINFNTGLSDTDFQLQ